jgi:cell division protein FtsN
MSTSEREKEIRLYLLTISISLVCTGASLVLCATKFGQFGLIESREVKAETWKPGEPEEEWREKERVEIIASSLRVLSFIFFPPLAIR